MVKVEISIEIIKYLELNDNIDTTGQNLQDAAKVLMKINV